jgi:hypothetical protein
MYTYPSASSDNAGGGTCNELYNKLPLVLHILNSHAHSKSVCVCPLFYQPKDGIRSTAMYVL